MLKKIVFVVVAVSMAAVSVYGILLVRKSGRMDKLQPALAQQVVAYYDTGTNSISRVNDSVLHYTLSWVNESEKALPAAELRLLAQAKLPLFLNLQIWSRGLIQKIEEDVTTTIVDSVYDIKMISLLGLLAQHPYQVYLRINGNMELPEFKYSWQNKSGRRYIASFRHIATLCRKYAPALKIVWGPSGYPGAEEYWPGNAYADLVSFNLNTVETSFKDPYPTPPSATEMIRRKLFRFRFIDKPALLLGTASINRASFRNDWIDTLNEQLKSERDLFRAPVIPAENDEPAVVSARSEKLAIGVYDPLLQLVQQPRVTTEHLFPNIGTVRDGSFKKEFDAVVARHHDVIVTMEAWRDGKKEKDSAVLINTLNGVYDDVWTRLYEVIANVRQTVYLRWGHEMEIPVERYPWQLQDPVTYIRAYRYFAHFPGKKAANVKMVWGPAGDRGSVEWWPGEDVVDLVSIAIYALPDKNINDFNKQKSFASIFLNKYHRMRFARKPLFITEFGVKGPEAYKRKWLEEAALTLNKFPELKGISYFNYADTPKAWGDAETPDWSITEATFKAFTGLLNGVRGQ